MNKKISKIKRVLALCLIFLFSINTFATSVNNNDGSAFITKAEFDALRSSFQSQIDTYNQNIDSKIDSAIASYLSGIIISSEFHTKGIYSPAEGVWSIESDATPVPTKKIWEEGQMRIKMHSGVGRLQSGTYDSAEVWFDWESGSDKEKVYSEDLVTEPDYNTGYAAWYGFKKTRQRLNISSFTTRYGAFSMNDAYKSHIYLYLNEGFGVISNTNMLQLDGEPYVFFSALFGEQNKSISSTNYIYNKGNQCNIQRNILDSDQDDDSFSGGLILNRASLAYNRFSNYDEIRDWCNDTDTSGHTAITNLSSFGGTMTGTTYYQLKTDNKFTSHNITASNCGFGTTYGTNADYRRVIPYIGFVTKTDDWNKLYVKALDDKYDSILLDTDPNKAANTITNNGIKHVKITAGCPVASFPKNTVVTYVFDFVDTTKDYYVWVKEDSFDSTKNLGVSGGHDKCISKFDLSKDTSVTYDSTWHCLKIKNGHGIASWKMSKNAVIFLKWAASNSSCNNGGGILKPMALIDCKLEQ